MPLFALTAQGVMVTSANMFSSDVQVILLYKNEKENS